MERKATKMGPQITRTPDFSDFWPFWEEVIFRRFLGQEKVGPKSRKIGKKVSEGAHIPLK